MGSYLNSRAADPAIGSGAVVPSLLFFLCSPLRTSSANASLITSSLRSNLSAPCGVFLRHSSIRFLHRSECACALLLSLIAAWASNRGSELVNVLLGDSLPLNACSLERQRRDRNGVHSNFWPVNCPPSICHSPRYSNHTVDSSCVPSVLRLQPSDFTSSEHTICIPDETFCAVVSHSKPNSVLKSGVHPVPRLRGDLPSQHFLSKRDKLLCRLLAVQSLKGRLSVTTFSGTWTGCIRRAPPTMA